MFYACVKGGQVVSVIVADEKFVQAVHAGVDIGADAMVDVTDVSPRPGPGWSYDGKAFTAPPDSA
jgi:hypothetical protein